MEAYIRVNKDNVVEFMNCRPFDPREGMGMSREELLKTGKIVSEIPEPENKLGCQTITKYDSDTNSLYYRYETVPLKDSARIEMLEKAINGILLKK